MGPVYKDLLSDSRKKHTMMIRRYNGFMNNSNTGYGEGPSTEDKLTMDNNFIKDISTKRPSTSKKLSGHEGDVNTGYGLVEILQIWKRDWIRSLISLLNGI